MSSRLFVQRSLILLPLLFTACTNGGGSDSAGQGETLTTGAYTIEIDEAIVVCADGTTFSRSSIDHLLMGVDGPLLTFSDGTEVIGSGSLDESGLFHATVTTSDETGEYVTTLDGQAEGTTVTGEAQVMYIPTTGATCAQNSRFTAGPEARG